MSAQEDYAEAEYRIEEARDSGANRLALFGLLDLEQFPPVIATLTNLKFLHAGGTRISDLTPLRRLKTLQTLELDSTQVSDLTPLQWLTALQNLTLNNTQTIDLAPLHALTALRTLYLSGTLVADLAPLQGLKAMQDLPLSGTRVTDLRPLAKLRFEETGSPARRGLYYKDTPALRDPKLADLCKIKDDSDRTQQTLAYLRSLPEPPAPLPWQTDQNSHHDSQGANDTTPAPEIATAQSHIQFILSHAATSQVEAQRIAEQIRFALRDVPATHGNQLPPVLRSMLDLADVFDRLSTAPIAPEDQGREDRLRREIARLEAQVEKLTDALKDETAAREAAEALANTQGFWSNYKSSLAKAAGQGTVALIGIASPVSLFYFLGPDHPLVQAYLTVLGRLPK